MASVFLSYSRADAARIRPLAAALERAGTTVWWDQHIGGGSQFADEIERALESADVVVVAWSKASTHSDWVRDEAAAGRDSGRLVPVTLDGCLPPMGFRQYQTIDLSQWNGRAGSKQLAPLKEAIAVKARERGAAPSTGRVASVTAARPSLLTRLLDLPRAALAAIAALALLLAAGAWYLNPFASPASISPSVALGEFKVISPDLPKQLSQALSEEILAAFGAEHEVSLITAGPGRRRAQFLLEGSVRKSADALHFTVNLKNVRTGGLIWSEAYDRALFDELAPRQVAMAASQVVRCGLWGAAAYRKPMLDKALALYVDWCNEYWGGSPDENRILDTARRVTVAVPDFSFGWSALALAAVPVSHRAADASAAKIGREGWQAAEKATELDRTNPEGYMAQAGLLPVTRFAERERLLTKAISVRPTECGCERQSYGDFLVSVGRFEEAAEEYDRAKAMMPMAPMSSVRLGQALHLVGRHREADEVIAEMLKIWPDAETLRLLQVKAALWTGRYAEALPILNGSELSLPDDQRAALQQAFSALQAKSPGQAQAAIAELERLASDPRRNDRLIVGTLAALGAGPAALSAAEALIRERGPALSDVLFEPNLAKMRGTNEYAQLVGKLGLLAYWRGGGRRPDFCRASGAPSFCSG